MVATDAKRCREEENGGKARTGRRGEKEEVRERRGATEESAVQCKMISSSGYICDDKIDIVTTLKKNYANLLHANYLMCNRLRREDVSEFDRQYTHTVQLKCQVQHN